MKKLFIGICVSIILLFSIIFAYVVITSDNGGRIPDNYNDQPDASSDGIIGEIDGSLLAEDSEIEIGDMV